MGSRLFTNHKYMDLAKVFSNFCENLHLRKELMTEDNVRYYWFASMLREDAEVEHYTMEYPYNPSVFESTGRRAKKELDFLYLNGDESYCMEIKFHRNPDPASAYAHTDAAGSLFNDIIRLSLFTPGKSFAKQKNMCTLPRNTRRLFLYVTDAEMNAYLAKGDTAVNAGYREELRRFYVRSEDAGFYTPKFEEVPATFSLIALEALSKEEHSLQTLPKIRLLHANSYGEMESESFKGRQCHVRLYEIQ